MTTTTLEPSFLQAVTLMTAFKPQPMKRAQAALIYIGLRSLDFTAAQLPEAIVDGNRHIAGAATGALVAIGLFEVVGRVKSPDPAAKGRKLDVLRIPDDKRAAAKTWLRANGFRDDVESQGELFPMEGAA